MPLGVGFGHETGFPPRNRHQPAGTDSFILWLDSHDILGGIWANAADSKEVCDPREACRFLIDVEHLGHLTCWESHGNSSASLTKAQSDLRTCLEPHELMPEDRCVHVCTHVYMASCVCVCSYMDAYLSKHMHIYKRYVRTRREVFKWVSENLIGPLEAGSGFTRCTEFVIVIVAFHTKQAAAWLQLSSWQRTSAFDRCPTSLRPSKATRRAPSAPRRHRRFASSASDFCCHS